MGRIDAFDMNWGAVAGGDPQPAAFPAGPGIVDPPVDLLGEEPHRIGNTKLDDAAVHQRVQGIGLVAGGDWRVCAQPEISC